MIDRDHYDILKSLHGDRVPYQQHIGIRRGLLATVSTLLADLRLLDPAGDKLNVRRVWSANAGFLKIDVDGTMPGLDDVIAEAENAARITCEHCGIQKPDLVVLKSDKDRDLLLCCECADIETAAGDHS